MTIHVPQSQPIDPRQIYRPEDNPNGMTVEEYAGLRDYVKERGFLQPALVTESHNLPHIKTDLPYIVVDGDHRVRLGIDLEMPVISAVVVNATEAERIRDRIAMNKRRGQLDVVAVGRDLERLVNEFEYNAEEIAHTGFSNEETLELLAVLKPRTGEEVLQDGVGTAPPPLEEPEKKWTMSLSFDSEAERARVKSVLLEFADGGSLATGLLRAVSALDNATDA